MQKVRFSSLKDTTLAGLLWKAPSKKIVIMAHGSGSNRLARGLFPEIAQALQEKNYNVLSFDFSGHGESQDDILSVKKSIDDVKAAIAFVKEKGYKNIILFGHSLGALACLENYSSDIQTMILIGALTGPVQWKWEDMCTPEQIEAMKETGYIAAQVNDGLREWVKIDGNLLNDLEAINQKELFKKIKCPLLIIHGDADQQERDLRDASQKGVSLLPPESELKILQGANHTFLEASEDIIALALEWIKRHGDGE